MYYLVTESGRIMGSFNSEAEAKEMLSPSYPEKVKLLTQDEYATFRESKDPVSGIKGLGVLLN